MLFAYLDFNSSSLKLVNLSGNSTDQGEFINSVYDSWMIEIIYLKEKNDFELNCMIHIVGK